MAADKQTPTVTWSSEDTSFLLLCQENKKHLGDAGEYADRIVESGKVSATMANTFAGMLETACMDEEVLPLTKKLNEMSKKLGLHNINMSRRHKLKLDVGILEEHRQQVVGLVPLPDREPVVVSPDTLADESGDTLADESQKMPKVRVAKSENASRTGSVVPKVKSTITAGKTPRASEELSNLIRKIVNQLSDKNGRAGRVVVS